MAERPAGLSAGRVQSVAVRLIVDREREIRAFVPVEYWSVDVRLTPQDDEPPFLARLIEVPEGKLAASPEKKGILLANEAEAAAHVDRLREAAYRVAEVREKEGKRKPAPPFTTSTLQQEAARKLGFSARKTMRSPSSSTRGSTFPARGQVGLITYMRTDSVNDRRAGAARDRRARPERVRRRSTRSPSRAATRRSRAARRRRTRRSARRRAPRAPNGSRPRSTATSSACTR